MAVAMTRSVNKMKGCGLGQRVGGMKGWSLVPDQVGTPRQRCGYRREGE